MRKGIGVISLVLGVLLLVKAHDIGDSPVSRLKRFFTGAPVDAAMKLYLAGTLGILIGLLFIFWKRK